MNRMKDKVVIITGAAQGIGATYARAMAAEGACVVVADVLDGATLLEELKGMGSHAIALKTDVSDETSAATMAAVTMEHFGRIDVLVNNAAIYASLKMRPFEEIDLGEWDRVMAVNVRGPFVCTRAVAPYMKAQGSGRIINISSGTPFKGTPGLLHYVTSKGAVLALTRALARELGDHGIAVNTLAPGLVLSEGVVANAEMRERLTAPVIASRAIKRDQVPDDLVGPLLFLASDDSAFMTGETVVVDGGSVMH
ncbi:SDR family NAD(P)-dependent oxidoreductase [Stutzerimonas azotifigens]|uniref:3-oxoacyl-ACP reductase FabG n=1 Tax=Stutzerimonas azotifigens TaxID=291995 RepID=A0ABR5Z2J1_9GAMM|nr:3-oxoacyl-ACP reductase family protein [Stutzerimonas azotifigens]MBA1274407.1 3-oxoacyl-ACP reductase FabG [Stutzerimonas azotifigens]